MWVAVALEVEQLLADLISANVKVSLAKKLNPALHSLLLRCDCG